MIAIGSVSGGSGGGGGDTITLGVYSDAGFTIPITNKPQFGTVYVKAVATGFTPTSYTFNLPKYVNDCDVVTKSVDSHAWEINEAFGDVVISVYATDGTNSAFNTFDFTVDYVLDRMVQSDGVVAYLGTRASTSGLMRFDGVDNPDACCVDLIFKMDTNLSGTIVTTGGNVNASDRHFYIVVAYTAATGLRVILQLTGTSGLAGIINIPFTFDTDLHHIAVSRIQTSATLFNYDVYFDGVQIAAGNGITNDANHLPNYEGQYFTLMGQPKDSFYFKGRIADCVIRSTALTPSYVAQRWNGGTFGFPTKDNDIVAYWKPIEPIGTIKGHLVDISGKSNNIQMQSFTSPNGVIAE